MTDLNTRVYKTVGRHFVTLSCIQRSPNVTTEKTLVFSGFVVEIKGIWFYVTAGHILKDIRTALAAGAVFDIWRLGDQTAGNKFKDVAIPYDFNVDEWVVLEDAELGLDYAAVQLRDFYFLQLQAGGVSAIDRNAWSDHVTDFDHWVLVGIPSETIEYDGENIITARVVLAPLLPIAEPDVAGARAENQFYAKLADGSELFVKNIDGMSGGPIFSLKYSDDMWRYGVIGVQSAWYPSTKVIAACPFSSFAKALEHALDES